MDPIRIYIGTERAQRLPTKVFEHTVLKRTTSPVEFHYLSDMETAINSKFRTGFSFFRWAIPKLCNFSGKAIYADADIVALCDIAELWNYPMEDYAFRARYRNGGPNKYTSVMLIDCGKAKWDFENWCEQLSKEKGKTLYKRFMDAHPDAPSGNGCGDLPAEFNIQVERGDVFDEKTAKMVHFTGLDKQPWRFQGKHPLEWLFVRELQSTIDAGYFEAKSIGREMKKGYVHKNMLKLAGR